jgi:hypothetical protein
MEGATGLTLVLLSENDSVLDYSVTSLADGGLQGHSGAAAHLD